MLLLMAYLQDHGPSSATPNALNVEYIEACELSLLVRFTNSRHTTGYQNTKVGKCNLRFRATVACGYYSRCFFGKPNTNRDARCNRSYPCVMVIGTAAFFEGADRRPLSRMTLALIIEFAITKQGTTFACLWSCPLEEGNIYLLNGKPSYQRNPSGESLLKVYEDVGKILVGKNLTIGSGELLSAWNHGIGDMANGVSASIKAFNAAERSQMQGRDEQMAELLRKKLPPTQTVRTTTSCQCAGQIMACL